MTFSKYFEIKNYLEYPIKLAPDPVEDISKFELNGEVVIPPSPNGRMFPKISLQEEEVIIAHMQKKSVTVNLSELDFSSLGLSTEPFYVQKLQIIDTENDITAGYVSFECSLFQTTPRMTLESCAGYEVREEKCPFGGALITISVKKDTGPFC